VRQVRPDSTPPPAHTPRRFDPKPLYGPDTWAAAETFKERLETAIVPDRSEREAGMAEIKDLLKAHLLETCGAESYAARQSEISPAWKDLQKKVMRTRGAEQ